MQHEKRNPQGKFPDQHLRQEDQRCGRRSVGEHLHACVLRPCQLDRPLSTGAGALSSPPCTGECIAPSAFDPEEVSTGLALPSDPPLPMVGLMALLGLPTPICSDLAFVDPPLLDGRSAGRANSIAFTALPTGAAAGIGAGSTIRERNDSSLLSYFSPPTFSGSRTEIRWTRHYSRRPPLPNTLHLGAQ